MPSAVNRIPLEEAIRLATSNVRPARPEKVLLEEAVNRISSSVVTSPMSFPMWDTSERDGYAVSSADLLGATTAKPVVLKVSQSVPLGSTPPPNLVPHTCAKILTGAALPEGADAVVQQEDVAAGPEGTVEFRGAVQKGTSVYPAGSDVKEGERLLARGQPLREEDVALLGSLGLKTVEVVPRLKVGVIATGSELVEHGSQAGPGKVVESNRRVLLAKLRGFGSDPLDLGLVEDDMDKISRLVRDSVAKCDALVTTGGSSVGGADLVTESVQAIGGRVLFHGLRLRPSSTAGLVMLEGKPIFILSGLLQSCLVALFSLALPTLRAAQGLPDISLPGVTAKLQRPVAVNWDTTFKRAVWVCVEFRGATCWASPTRASSHSRSILSRSDGFFVASGGKDIPEGTLVDVVLTNGLPWRGGMTSKG